MNKDYLKIISASTEERRDLFLYTSNQLGTTLQNVEKDFWVCFILDLLFNGRKREEPRLLFKGGTSLSKGYNLISRFSEDLDITVFREDIGDQIELEKMESMSGKKQRKYIDDIKEACQNYIQNDLRNRLNHQITAIFESAIIGQNSIPVIQDPDDPDRQTLLVYYPSIIVSNSDYIKPSIKIEAGARSALEPHQVISVKPYLADAVESNLDISNITAIKAERTFWDKIVILHGLRRWFENRGQMRNQGHRVSRHYYDIYMLMNSYVGESALKDVSLGIACARHAKIFFNSADLDLSLAFPGSFSITPTNEMINVLRKDYNAMSTMIFGDVPAFSQVISVINEVEYRINNG